MVSFERELQRLQQVQNSVALKSSRGKAFPQMWNEGKNTNILRVKLKKK